LAQTADGSARHSPIKAPADREEIVDAFYSKLASLVDTLDSELAEERREIVLIDLRNVVGSGEWYDELHPTSEGFAKIGAEFRSEILKPYVA
jgi:hypothetical protein